MWILIISLIALAVVAAVAGMIRNRRLQKKIDRGELDAITRFDALDITFTNVGVAYSVKDEKAILESVTVRTDRAAGFSAFIYSFPTENNGSRTSVDVVYLKGGVEVNRTNGALDTGITFKSSKRSNVHMEILNEDWVETKWEGNEL